MVYPLTGRAGEYKTSATDAVDGYLSGQDHGRPAVEIFAAEKMKALLVEAISDGAVGRLISNTAINKREIDGAVLVFWSQMHGLTLLLVDGLVGPSETSDELTESIFQSMLDGLTKRIPTIPLSVWIGPSVPPQDD